MSVVLKRIPEYQTVQHTPIVGWEFQKSGFPGETLNYAELDELAHSHTVTLAGISQMESVAALAKCRVDSLPFGSEGGSPDFFWETA